MNIELSVDCLNIFDSNLKKIKTIENVYPALMKKDQLPNVPVVNVWVSKHNGNTEIINISNSHIIWCGKKICEKNPLNEAVKMEVFIEDKLIMSGFIEMDATVNGYFGFKQYLNGVVITYQLSKSLLKHVTFTSYRPVDEALLTFI